MTATIIILTSILSMLYLVLIYCLYQLLRNEATYKIVRNWLDSDDKRYYRYSYDFIFDPSRHNRFGFQFPKESNFK